MTDDERALYARMTDREQRAIDRLSPELQSGAIVLWARSRGRPAYRPRVNPPTTPDRTTVDPIPEDDSDRRHP